MSLNKVILNGRIPNFEPTYYPQEGDKSAFLQMSISVKRNFKKANEKYYPEDLIRIKAFGPTATFIKDYFKTGAGINIEGALLKDDPYTDNNGEEKAGQYYVYVEKAYFPDGNVSENNTSSSNTKNTGATAASRPGASRVPGGASRANVPGGAGRANVPGSTSRVPGSARRTQGGPPMMNR